MYWISLKKNIDIEQVDKDHMGDNDDFAIDIDADDGGKDYKPIIQALKDDVTKDDAVNVTS